MSTYKSDFLNILANRGFIHQVSEPEVLDALAHSSTITAYIGFDCTAPSLHIGSLLPIMMLHWLQQTGHRPIALMGGGTTRVGDPSGKDESRKILTDTDIKNNLSGIRAIFSNFLRFRKKRAPLTPMEREDIVQAVTRWKMSKAAADRLHPSSGAAPKLSPETMARLSSVKHNAAMANNADWLDSLNYVDFLRDIGRHFSINRMLAFDSVKLRLDRQQELSFLEFNYMILQAYDFVELFRRYGCVLQMGGSDQWGNIVNGIDLGRRLHNAQFFALTSPLITTSSGAKMGKTAAGAVWLNADLVSPYDYWQYWRNTEDADVVRFLRLFTILPLDEIERLGVLKDAEINEAKKVLATEATALVHGRQAAEEAAATARATFEEGGLSTSLPTVELPRAELKSGIGVLSAFVKAGLAASNGEVRRAIANNAILVNDVRVTGDKAVIGEDDVTAEGVIKLSLGKKRHVLLKPV
ncbi:MAG: tyrosine--tRNA ligase [Xanthobacteraceae bacterium]